MDLWIYWHVSTILYNKQRWFKWSSSSPIHALQGMKKGDQGW